VAITEASFKLGGARLADHHRAFLSEIVSRLSASRTLCLPILSIGGTDAAFILGMVERGVFYDITLAYAETFEKLSPGSFLMQHTLEALASCGIQMVVSHGAHEYKRHWATRFVPQKRIFVFRPGLRTAAARFIRFSLLPLWGNESAQDASMSEPWAACVETGHAGSGTQSNLTQGRARTQQRNESEPQR
jgi:hypothetical protein